MNKPDLKKILKKVESFPSMPGAASKVLSIIDDPDASALQLEEALRHDPGLTANILRMTNSPYFGVASEVGSLRRAIVVLGVKRVTQIIIASCLSGVMSKPVMGYDLSPGELWKHSIAVSVSAEGLIKELSIPAADEIFTAALLHDVGKLILGEFLEGRISDIEKIASKGVPFHDAERNVLGTDHAEVGARLLEKWSFPEGIVYAVRWHHDPDSADTQNTLVDVVHAADVLCMMIGIGVGRDGLNFEISPSTEERLGIEDKHLDVVSSLTLDCVNELSDVFESG